MREHDEVDQVTGEVIDSIPSTMTALAQITGAEIDKQISTAHQYPRSMTQFKKRAMEMATLDEETAVSCIYRRPVGKDRAGNPIYAEGKSIRMAEIVGASYGNLRVQAMLIEQTDRQVTARGVAHDLESNFAASSEVVESTVDRYGKPFSERMRVVIAKAALAKARRDATFMVVPGALCKSIEQAAREVAFGEAKTMDERRAMVMEWLGKIGVEPGRVFSALGINGPDEIGVEQLDTLTGLRTAIKDREVTVDEAFPPIEENMPADGAQSFGFNKGKEKPEPDSEPKQPATAPAPAKEPEPKAEPEPEPAAAPPAADPPASAPGPDADPAVTTAQNCVDAMMSMHDIDEATAKSSLAHFSITRFHKAFAKLSDAGYAKVMEAIADNAIEVRK